MSEREFHGDLLYMREIQGSERGEVVATWRQGLVP